MDAAPSPRLADNSRIAIIGGGPAGSFFALSALSIAARPADRSKLNDHSNASGKREFAPG